MSAPASQHAKFRAESGQGVALVVVALLGGLIYFCGSLCLAMVRSGDGLGGLVPLGIAVLLGYMTAHVLWAAFGPILIVTPEAVVCPGPFRSRTFAVTADRRVGRFDTTRKRGTQANQTHRKRRPIAEFYTLDDAGKKVKLISCRPDGAQVHDIRRALEDIAGLTLEGLRRDPQSASREPDLSHWG